MDQQRNDRSFRILSLDGGAFAGVFTLRVLAEIEKRSGKKISEFFDGFSGISAGSFLGAILSHGDISAKDLIDEIIFTIKKMRSSTKERIQTVWGALKPALSHERKWDGLYRYFAGSQLKDLKIHGVFPIWDFEKKQIRIFDTHKHPDIFVCDVVFLSTGANTVYGAVDSKLSEEKFSGSDLALLVNDPRLLAIMNFADKIKQRGAHILSVGSSLSPTEHKNSSFKKGPLRWIYNILPEIRRGQESFVNQSIDHLFEQQVLPIQSHLRLNLISKKLVDGFRGDDELNIFFLELAEELIERRSYDIDQFIDACLNNTSIHIPVRL
jgi:patatin-like phospholipase/acyl hydrolase